MTTAAAAKADSWSGFTAWYSELAVDGKRTFWACFGGWTLDALDAQMFSFAIPAIIAAFSITNADAGLIGTVTLLTSAIGGWSAGMLADRFGRVRTLQITVVWFAFFTFLCGFAQSYLQLLVFRTLMGLGFGGEWAAGAVLIGETIHARYRGRAVGSVQSGWAVGWAFAAILSTVLFTTLPQDTAWRALFWVGLGPAFFLSFGCGAS
jgi:MFS family permease